MKSNDFNNYVVRVDVNVVIENLVVSSVFEL